MLACDGFWQFTVFRFRNRRRRVRLHQKPSNLRPRWIERNEPKRESPYSEACFAVEKMSTHGDGRTTMAGTDICRRM